MGGEARLYKSTKIRYRKQRGATNCYIVAIIAKTNDAAHKYQKNIKYVKTKLDEGIAQYLRGKLPTVTGMWVDMFDEGDGDATSQNNKFNESAH